MRSSYTLQDLANLTSTSVEVQKIMVMYARKEKQREKTQDVMYMHYSRTKGPLTGEFSIYCSAGLLPSPIQNAGGGLSPTSVFNKC